MISAVQTESQVTKSALIDAAAEVFSKVGFRAATVREICQRAGANIAAVNYHFGDKTGLYVEVLRHTQTIAYQQFPPDLGLKPNATAEEKLKAYIHSFMLRIFAEGKAAYHGQIMSREMIDPSEGLDTLVGERIRPMAVQLNAIVGELLGGNATDEEVRLCASSIVSQCCFYHHCRPVLSRLFPNLDFSAPELAKIAEHINAFSLAAVKDMRARITAAKRKGGKK